MSADVLWGGPPVPSRGPKPSLTLEQIAAAAVAVADADGLAALSMQRVATDLGFTKMSLYRYLPGRTELVALMVERALGEPPALAGGGWRADLAEWTGRLMAGYLRHPWTLAATVGPRPLGPNELGWMEQALAALAGTPLGAAERLDAVVLLVGHARMLAEQAASARSEAGLAADIGALLRDRAGRFPHLAEAMAGAEGGREQAYAFGLDRILDGLEKLMTERRL